jgi:WD40 repeat protein
MFCAGYWDGSFRIISIDTNNSSPQIVDVVYGHHDIVTCITLAEDGKTLVTGSRDTTVIAWELVPQGNDLTVRQETRRVFYGHDEEVKTNYV